nr:PREDICTED: tumor necrosis factor receptor superfamily member 3 [Latimeria chalumnae]|eukprot:XP_014351924.1 PREDICTED: tumor necrosis factor receptor superfamily member 3 [Latimeria chalumnae]
MDTFVPLTLDTLVPLTPDTFFVPLTPDTLLPLTPDTFVPLTPDTFVPLTPDTLVPLTPDTFFVPLTPDTFFVPLTMNTLVPLPPDTLVPLTPDTFFPYCPLDGNKCNSSAREYFQTNDQICCSQCPPDDNLVELQTCNRTSGRRCRCKSGYQCSDKLKNEYTCELCKPIPSKYREDPPNPSTTATVCQPGTFSNSSGKCQKHTNCTEFGKETAIEGTSNSDAICKDQEGRKDSAGATELHLEIFILLLLLLCLLLGCKFRHRYRHELSCLKKVFKTCFNIEKEKAVQMMESNRQEQQGSKNRNCCHANLHTTVTDQNCVKDPPLCAEQGQDWMSQLPPSAAQRTETQPLGQSVGEQPSGVIGPLHIYSSSAVFVSCINTIQGSCEAKVPSPETTLPAHPLSEEEEGGLCFPQQEQNQTDHLWTQIPHQESGKEYHLPEKVSDLEH